MDNMREFDTENATREEKNPMSAHSAADDIITDITDITTDDTEKVSENIGSTPPKKKRGRPRKNPDTDAVKESSLPTEDNHDDNTDILKEECNASDENTVTEPTLLSNTEDELSSDIGDGNADTDSDTDSATDSDADGEFIIPSTDGEIFPLFMTEDTLVEESVTDLFPLEAEEEDTEEEEHGEDDNEGSREEHKETQKKPLPKRQKKERPEREVGSRGIDTLFDFLELFIFTFVAVLLVTTFICRHSVVSGSSMINTLHDGDKLIISDLFYTPDYGDIVVVEDHTAGITSPVVKRVIALEGDLVRVTYLGISVNGEMLAEEDYVFTDGIEYRYDLNDHIHFKDYEDYAFLPGVYYEFRVPEDEIYILGDHRNDSTDSRRRGTVREDSVLGRVIVRFYPFNDFKFF